MYISDIKKQLFGYIIVSLICALICVIYYQFSHNVYSLYMTYLFAIPLIGGFIRILMCLILGKKSLHRFSKNAYNSGIATLTVGSLLKAVLEIAGTSSVYEIVFWIVGGLLIVIGIIGFFLEDKK